MKTIAKIFLLLLGLSLLFSQDDDVLSNYRLRKINITGNHSFRSNQLRRLINIRPVYTKSAMQRITYRYIKSQRKNIQNYYISEGFLNCTVQDSFALNTKKQLHLYFNVRENERFFIRKISIEGNTVLSDGEILELLDMRVGDPFRQYVYYDNINKILTRYSELGYPFANVREEFVWKPEMDITLNIQEDKSYRINKISVRGNKKVLESSIHKHIDFKKDDIYRLDPINRTQDWVYEMGAFSSVKAIPVNIDSEKQELDLELRVVESKARRFDIEFGASQGYTEKIGYSTLYVQPQWQHKNMLSRAHRFSAGLRYEAVFHKLKLDHGINASVSYTLPWLIEFRLPTTFKLYFNRNIYSPFSDLKIREDDVLTDYGVNLSSIWRYSRNTYVRTSVALKSLKSELSGQGFEPLTEVLLQGRFDNRDNFVYPTKGWNILLYSGYVLGMQEETQTDYFRIETSLNKYSPIMRNLVAAGRFEIGQFFDRRAINPIYLYRMGSESTVRGWFQSIGDPYETASGDTIYAGKSKIMANAELRFDLIWNFGVNAFLDAGRLDEDFKDIFSLDKYYINTGFGIYYKTPIGPVRLELPILINNPNKGTELDVERSFYRRVNFGLLFAF